MRKMPYKPPFLRDFPGNKKAAHAGGRLQTSGHFVSKRLCKGVWIVDVIIVEDVLVLFRECIVRHSHLILMAGGGIIVIGTTLIPLLSGLF